MSFSDAQSKAQRAKVEAQMAYRDASESHDEHLARSVQLLAEAVAELAGSLHRSDIG